LNDADFQFLQNLLRRRSGLSLTGEKRYLVDARLSPIARANRLDGIDSLIARLRAGAEEALVRAVVEAMATNETYFFRDRQPFDQFETGILPSLLEARARERYLRIWSAGTSSGQEAYSIAMILREQAAKLAGWRVDLIGTDLSGRMIGRAQQGRYSQFEVQRGLPINHLLNHFTQTGDAWQINDGIRAMVDFKTLNLLDPFSALGTFDVIFCRNVLIYFDPQTKGAVFDRLADQLAPDGRLVLGSAESVIGLSGINACSGLARGIDWIKPYTKVKDTSFNDPVPADFRIRWFEDGVH
jgi:chemotaxis protein methyltransferase CheR